MKTSSLKKPFLITVIGLAALLLALYAAIPHIAKYYLNHYVLADMGDYTGRVDSIRLDLPRGSYQLQELNIHLKESDPSNPFFYTESLNIHLSWFALRNREILVDVALLKPQLHLVDSPTGQAEQKGEGTNWLAVFDQILPTTLNRLDIIDGKIRFTNSEADPAVDFQLNAINAHLENLTNVRDQNGRRVASATLAAIAFTNTPLTANATFDPFQHDDFQVAVQSGRIPLREINDFAKAYAGLDFKSGDLQLFSEFEADSGKMTGYVKPLLEDVNIASWEQDVVQQNDNPIQLTWETLMGFLGTTLTNLETDKLATEISIDGTIDQTKIGTWPAVWGIIENAFIEAIQARFNQLTPLTQES
ncbi:DUF748 domain-containing protein [Gilvimarinus xylanilyticus]|uniref:DUF748 domain-containing protein n=1 Tax=Gilvimarinus xylanilyticus TaxID=2944139 RepID=A0A9X2KU44_9GAMM|nr:DUF748 domain-containing protein [Gilvimarinus xylanilyticus]MCP8900521.1 DUF748 domain-containing protein [Gilvimarinus xylanilyticus]